MVIAVPFWLSLWPKSISMSISRIIPIHPIIGNTIEATISPWPKSAFVTSKAVNDQATPSQGSTQDGADQAPSQEMSQPKRRRWAPKWHAGEEWAQ
jgi:hypothetical protein